MKKQYLLTNIFILVASVASIAQITTSEVTVETTNNITSINGKVGIGTNQPGYSMEIKADENNKDLFRLSHPTSPNGAGFTLGFGENSNQLANGAIDFKVEYSDNQYNVLKINRENRDFTYLGDGFVGIGTSSPGYLVDIKASANDQELIRLSHPTSPDDAGFILGFGQNKDQLANGAIDFKVEYSNTDFGVLGINRANRDFYYNGDGNVGIGTNAPNYKLDVNGSLNATSLYNSGQLEWSDFVFRKSYKLPSLIQVEEFIKTNGHLKDIPSEKEVLEKGYDLGTMDSKLLQKIEELTLYMVEMNKRVLELEKENQELKSEVTALRKEK